MVNVIHGKIISTLTKLQIWNEKKVEDKFYTLSTDNRSNQKFNVFLCLKGERFDAFDLVESFIPQCEIIIFQFSLENEKKAQKLSLLYPLVSLIMVADTVLALQALASEHVKHWYELSPKNKLIAISGSNGKTTTKEMLAHILSTVYPEEIISTLKNNNNHIGVPLTLLSINPLKTKYAVVEFGSNHPGEMKVLCDLAYPNMGITTNIGHTHMEFFPTVQDVFVEEAQIFYAIMQVTHGRGIFLINADDEYLNNLEYFPNCATFSISKEKNADLYYEFNGTNTVKVNGENGVQTLSNNHIMGKHNFINLANAYVLAESLAPENAGAFASAAESFTPTFNRSHWYMHEGKSKIFLDAYNANPSSMKAALLGFKEYCQAATISLHKALLVLGDMKELGASESDYHKELGQFVQELGFTRLIYVGEFEKEVATFYKGSMHSFKHVGEAQSFVRDALKSATVTLFKASRSLQLERLLDISKV
jgi:UDP-N-acetylmuramoyl-tripeptide--D-alanyl-D-alanine ligase